ncbi:MAG: cytochrome b/b6 domain-containing protein [Myxococcales bacterium]|nr:cytochrome b/b6 domain-containing protein [Myxococcales bacterium]MDD9967084.1 cytochrome b/b6 domain-containing protein [Myxococcales bacterium]
MKHQADAQRINARWLVAWHWAQAACFLGLLATGLSMHYDDAQQGFLPFRVSVLAHNWIGVINAGLWLVFVLGNAFGGNGAHYRPKRAHHFRKLWQQIRFYLYGMFQGEKAPFPPGFDEKFNPVQKFAYLVVMYGLMPLAIASGLGLLFPLLAPAQTRGRAGLWYVAVAHLSAGYLMSLFLIFHVYLATTGETAGAYFREMLTGMRTSRPPPPR